MIEQRPERPSFFDCSTETIDEADLIIAGFSYDCTASFRPGARFGPKELRNYPTEGLETFSFYFGEDVEEVAFYDAGDMPARYGDPAPMIEAYRSAAEELIRRGKRLIALGGEHLITYPIYLATQQVQGDFTLLHLDAHADLAVIDYLGERVSHGTVMNLCLEKGLKKLIQYGIRSGTKAEYDMRENDNRIIPSKNLLDVADSLAEKERIYLSLDVDYFDPAFVSGTGTPEAGGGSFGDYIEVLRMLRTKKVTIIGADIVELAPELDASRNSTVFVGKVLRELLLTMDVLR